MGKIGAKKKGMGLHCSIFLRGGVFLLVFVHWLSTWSGGGGGNMSRGLGPCFFLSISFKREWLDLGNVRMQTIIITVHDYYFVSPRKEKGGLGE